MADDYRDKLRSLNLRAPSRVPETKVTTDVHDHHTVDVTEHLSDRMDVNIKASTLKLSTKMTEA